MLQAVLDKVNVWAEENKMKINGNESPQNGIQRNF